MESEGNPEIQVVLLEKLIEKLASVGYPPDPILQFDILHEVLTVGLEHPLLYELVRWLAYIINIRLIAKTTLVAYNYHHPWPFLKSLDRLLKELNCPFAVVMNKTDRYRFKKYNVCYLVLDFLANIIVQATFKDDADDASTTNTYIPKLRLDSYTKMLKKVFQKPSATNRYPIPGNSSSSESVSTYSSNSESENTLCAEQIVHPVIDAFAQLAIEERPYLLNSNEDASTLSSYDSEPDRLQTPSLPSKQVEESTTEGREDAFDEEKTTTQKKDNLK